MGKLENTVDMLKNDTDTRIGLLENMSNMLQNDTAQRLADIEKKGMI